MLSDAKAQTIVAESARAIRMAMIDGDPEGGAGVMVFVLKPGDNSRVRGLLATAAPAALTIWPMIDALKIFLAEHEKAGAPKP